MNQSESITALAKALIAVQGELTPVTKDKENPYFHSKYVGLDTVMPMALALLNKHGLALSQVPDQTMNGLSALRTTLMHESGEWMSGVQPLLMAKEDPQGQGSAITYARRYAAMSMLGIVAESDDDGNAASAPRTPPAQQYADSGRGQGEQMAQEYSDKPRPTGPMLQAKHMPSSQYAGKCYNCGEKYEKGEPIYFQKVDGKSRCWHEECYTPEP